MASRKASPIQNLFLPQAELSFQWSANAGTPHLTHCYWWVTAIQIPCLWVDYLIRWFKGPISAHWIIIISWKWVNRHRYLSQKMKEWMYGWGEKKKKRKMIVFLQYVVLGRTLSVQAYNRFLSGRLKDLIVKRIGTATASSFHGTLKISRAWWLSVTTGGEVLCFNVNEAHKNLLVHLRHGGTLGINVSFEKK